MRLLLFFLLISYIAGAQQKSNIIYIMSDDHDNDAISAYNKQFIQTPNLDRIAKEGVRFNKAFVGNSICAPARATLLTGQHSHKNGVKNNTTRFDSSKTNIAHLLNNAGYQTALIGKWHLHSYPTGFTYWRILPGMGQYHDTRMITMKGDTITEKGYSTDVITDDAMQWLESRDRSKPFALFLHHKAPHRNFVPDLKYLEKFHTQKFPEPATLYTDTTGHGSAWRIQTMSILPDMRLCGDLKIDPQYLADIPALKPAADDIATYNAIIRRMPEAQRERYKEIYAERGKLIQQLQPTGKELLKYKYQWYMQDYLACIASIDESVGRVLKWIDDNKLTDNTAVIYTSDQGFYLGENGWFDKRFAYDVSMGTPLLIKWPGHIKPGTVNNQLVQNIDYAPTLLGMAGAVAPASMHGINLVPLLEGKEKNRSRKYLYYHYYEFVKDHTVIPHLAVRGDRYKLIYFYTVNEWELYDLQNDPAEQKNLIQSASHQQLIKELKIELNKLRDLYDDHEAAGELQ
jgi:arylsulfatase A-like enzyme